MENNHTQPESTAHPDTNAPQEKVHDSPTKNPPANPEPAHNSTHEETNKGKTAEPEKAHAPAPVSTGEKKQETKEPKAEKKPEEHPAAPQATSQDSPSKNESPTKPKEATDKKDASPSKPKEESNADHAKPNTEVQKSGPPEHKEAKEKEASPTKAKPETDASHNSPVKDAQKSAATEHKDASPVKPQPESNASPTKPAVAEHKDDSPAKHQPEPNASPTKPAAAEHKEAEKKETHDPKKEAHHEPEHKPTASEVKEAHKEQEKSPAPHEPVHHEAESAHTRDTSKEHTEKPQAHKLDKNTDRKRSDELKGRVSEPRTSAGGPLTKERIEEVRKMKQATEEQLKFLNKELHVLVKKDKIEKQVLSADISKKTLVRDPLISQKNSAKLLRPIDKSAFDQKGKPKTVQSPNIESADQDQEGLENPRKKLGDIKRAPRLGEEPLYMKMEKQFFEKVVCPELEMRKEALKQKREFSKPIELKEIKEHASKYQQASKKETMNKQMARLEKEAVEHEKAEKVINVYKSSMLKKVLEHDEEEKIRDDKKAQEKKQLKDRQLQYGKLVKEMYKPKVDNMLRQGLLDKLQAEQDELALRKARQAKEPKTEYSGKTWKSKLNKDHETQSTGNVDGGEGKSRVERFLTKPRVKKDINLPETLPESELPDALKKINDDLKEKIEKSGSSEGKPRENGHAEAKPKVKNHTVSPSPKKKDRSNEREVEGEDNKETDKEKPKKAYTNYLDDVRKKRVEQEKNGAKVKYGHWEKHLKNKEMSYQDKVLNILDDVNRIEHQAKLKEEKLKQQEHGQGGEPVDLEGQVTDMYLESIKAKLALIQGLS